MSKRPNILFAIADDASHFGIYGHSFVNTPNIDRVGNRGIVFNNAFTTNPKCAPSRASIFTGRHTWQLEEACNHVVCTFPEKFECYPDILMENDYFVGFTGKGWAPGIWKTTREYNPAGPEFSKYKNDVPKDTNVSECDYSRNFEDFLQNRPKDTPFCFWYGCFEPHRHYVQGEGERNGKKQSDIEQVPSYWPDEEVVRSDMLDYAFEIEWFDMHLGRMIKTLEENGELENTVIIVTSDNGCPFPRVKGQMYEQDFHLPLVMRWDDKVKSGRKVDDMISFTDFAPTMLELAGLDVHPQMSGKSFYDILLRDNDNKIDGDRKKVYMGRECHDCGREGDVGYPVRCVRDDKYLYVHNFAPDRWPAGNPETLFPNYDGSPTKDRIIELNDEGESRYYDLAFGKHPQEELYDIQNDPECIINLANKEEFAALKSEMWEDLQKFLHQTQDPRILGDGDIFDRYVVEKFSVFDSSWQAYKEGRWKMPGYMNWKEFRKKD